MLSFEHELIVDVVRKHPELVLDLLRSAFDLHYPGAVELAMSTENLTEVQPPERRADAVLVLRDTGDPRARHVLVVEVQLQPDIRKRLSWPVYVAVLRARLACPVTLVVLALDHATANWCATPIELDDNRSVLRPRVIGPARVPTVTVDAEAARRYPELAVLSLLAHRDEPVAIDLGRALLSACDGLDEHRSKLYADVVYSFINEAARRALEAEMNLEKYEFQSEFLRNRLAEGREEGRVEGLARAVLTVLEARRLSVSDEQRNAILGCIDPDELEAWLQRAATADRTNDIFGR